MRRLVMIGCASALLAAVGAVPAQAQLGGAAIPFVDGRADAWPRGQIGVELGVHSSEGLVAESVLFGGWYRLAPAFALEASLGFVNAHDDDGESSGTPANPFLAAYYVRAVGRTMLRVGGGIAPGLAGENHDGLLVFHWVMRGLRDLWLLLSDSVSLVPRFRLDHVASEAVVLGADVDFGIHVSTDGGDSEVTGQLGIDFTGRAGSSFQAGLRLQLGSWLTDDSDRDFVQMSIVPFVRAVFGAGYVDLRLLVNLDEPGGFAFDQGGIWTLSLGGGARL